MAESRRLWGKVVGIVTRGLISRVDSGNKVQLITARLNADEDSQSEHIEPYGFTSNPPEGAECVVLNVGAERGHPVVIVAGDRRHRVTGLASGEVAIHADTGATITLKANGDIVVDPKAGSEIQLGAGATESVVLGDLWQTLYNAHTHSTAMGPSGVPIVPSTATQLSAVVKSK